MVFNSVQCFRTILSTSTLGEGFAPSTPLRHTLSFSPLPSLIPSSVTLDLSHLIITLLWIIYSCWISFYFVPLTLFNLFVSLPSHPISLSLVLCCLLISLFVLYKMLVYLPRSGIRNRVPCLLARISRSVLLPLVALDSFSLDGRLRLSIDASPVTPTCGHDGRDGGQIGAGVQLRVWSWTNAKSYCR